METTSRYSILNVLTETRHSLFKEILVKSELQIFINQLEYVLIGFLLNFHEHRRNKNGSSRNQIENFEEINAMIYH